MKNKEKILVALSNKEYLNIISRYSKIEVIGSDIQYKEGILEILDIYKNIDTILINPKIPGKIKNNELKDKIKFINNKIKIIEINKKEDLERYLEESNIHEIIAYLGAGGVGKSTAICNMNRKTNRKTLIIDRNKNDNSITIIFNKKRTKEKIIKIEENIFFYNKYINEKEIYKNKKIYEKIIIEIHDTKEDNVLIKNANKIFLIIDSDLLTIYKSNKIMHELKKLGVKKEMINIIINNKKMIRIDKNIIEEIFYGCKVINMKEIKNKRRLIWN